MKIAFFFLCFGGLACGSSIYTGEFMDYRHAISFSPCPNNDIETPRNHALIALQSSLADVNWVVETIDNSQMYIDARACKQNNALPADYLKRTDDECATVRFIVKENAEIHAVIPNEKPAHNSVIRNLNKWMYTLERVYAELRCYNDELLAERIAGKKIKSNSPIP